MRGSKIGVAQISLPTRALLLPTRALSLPTRAPIAAYLRPIDSSFGFGRLITRTTRGIRISDNLRPIISSIVSWVPTRHGKCPQPRRPSAASRTTREDFQMAVGFVFLVLHKESDFFLKFSFSITRNKRALLPILATGT